MHPHPLGTATTWVASRQADFPVFSPHNMEGLMCEKRERVKLATARTRRKWRVSQSDVRFSGHPVNKNVHSNYAKWGG